MALSTRAHETKRGTGTAGFKLALSSTATEDRLEAGGPRPTTAHASNTAVAYATLQTPIGLLHLFGTPRGLLTIALPNEAREQAEARVLRLLTIGEARENARARVRRLLGAVEIREDEAALATALEQLTAYFAGTLRAFKAPLDARGTPFQRRVWDAVAAVPYGETRSYAEIARTIGRPAAVRAVGAANGANPLPPIVPCHRIVGSNGALTGYGGGIDVKRQLLELEGYQR